jgi:hypothetical protein
MNRLSSIGGRSAVTGPITVTETVWEDPPPFSLAPPMILPIKTITPSVPPSSTTIVNPIIKIGTVPCTNDAGEKGIRFIDYYEDGTFSFATECIVSAALNS